MNEELRDKRAVEYAEKTIGPPSSPGAVSTSFAADHVLRAFIAGWKACYAEMLTTRRETPDWHEPLVKREQTRDE